MATVTHTFVSGIANDPTAAAAGEVLPSHWNAVHTISGIRSPLTAALTYYIRTTGSDSNNGLTPATAFATIQHACNIVNGVTPFPDGTTFDFGGNLLTINVGIGTFASAFIFNPVGGGELDLTGQGSTQTTISDFSNDCFDVFFSTTLVKVNKLRMEGGSAQCFGVIGPPAVAYLGSTNANNNCDVTFAPQSGVYAFSCQTFANLQITTGTVTFDGVNGGTFFLGAGIFESNGTNFATWAFTNNPVFGATVGLFDVEFNSTWQDAQCVFTGASTGQPWSLKTGSSLIFNNAITGTIGNTTGFVDSNSAVYEGTGHGVGIEFKSGAPLDGATHELLAGLYSIYKDSGQATATKGLALYADDAGTVFPMTPLRTVFADLPASPHQGDMASITDGLAANCADGSCTTFGTNVTGGTGALNLLIWYNGAHWTLMGK